MKILVLNAGSSSVKYQLFQMDDNHVLASGLVEQIGEKESTGKMKYKDIHQVEHTRKKNFLSKIMMRC